MTEQEPEGRLIEVEPNALEALTHAEVDMQIATAHRFPRDLAKFKRNARAEVCLDIPTAESCWYTLPARKGDGEGKEIEGPSVRLAEIIASNWGNLRAQARIIEVGATYLVAQGNAWDLENNLAVSVEVRRSITGKRGRYGENMIQVTANAASSIAFRNALFKVIPRAHTNALLKEAQRYALVGVTIEERRAKMLAKFGELGITPEQVLGYAMVAKLEDVTVDHITSLVGLFNALREGSVSKDEVFGSAAPEETERVVMPHTVIVKEAADVPLLDEEEV